MVTEESVINSIAKGETPNSTLDEDKLKLANDNMLSLYFNFNTNLGLLFGLEKYIGEYDSLSLTSNNLDNNHIQTIVKVDAKDEKTITFDANHEMAGKELNFRIELVEVK